jgi:hypothetical protein
MMLMFILIEVPTSDEFGAVRDNACVKSFRRPTDSNSLLRLSVRTYPDSNTLLWSAGGTKFVHVSRDPSWPFRGQDLVQVPRP